jgi:iron complex outermembrane receptor protein
MRTQVDEYKPFWMVNSKLDWKSGNIEVYTTVSNLFDKKYFDLGPVEQPGRWISIGFNYQINFD